MSRKNYPFNVLEQARTILNAWNQIGAESNFGIVTNDSLTEDIHAAATLEAQMESLELQLTDLRNQRDDLYTGMWDKLKRVRSGVKAYFGDDSTQYELVGGTRLSERKSPTRKALPVVE